MITVDKVLADDIEKQSCVYLKETLDQNAEHLPMVAYLYEDLVKEAWERRRKGNHSNLLRSWLTMRFREYRKNSAAFANFSLPSILTCYLASTFKIPAAT